MGNNSLLDYWLPQSLGILLNNGIRPVAGNVQNLGGIGCGLHQSLAVSQ